MLECQKVESLPTQMRRTVLSKQPKDVQMPVLGWVLRLGGGIVTGTFAHHCNMTTLNNNADAGIGAGESQQSTVSHTTAVKCNLKTFRDGADAGIGVGFQMEGTVTGTTAIHSTVVTNNRHAAAGIGAGSLEKGTISYTKAVELCGEHYQISSRCRYWGRSNEPRWYY